MVQVLRRVSCFFVWATVLAAGGAARAVPPLVSHVHPSPLRVNVPANTVIEVAFDQTIDPATVDALSYRVFGRWSGPAAGTITLDGPALRFTPAQPFFAGELVTVYLSKALKNLAGEPLAQGYAFTFWIKTVGTLLDLEYIGRTRVRQNGESWVQLYGAYGGDLDHNGYSDLSIPCEITSDMRVLLNVAGSYPSFTVESLPGGATPSPIDGGDFDLDGHIDVVVANIGGDKISVLFGDGTGDFPVKTSYAAAAAPSHSIRGVGVLDLNGDGWDDIVAADRHASSLSVFLNNGDGTFAAAVAKETGGSNEWSIAIADANNDGLLDVICGNRVSPYYVVVMLSDGTGNLIAQPPVAPGGYLWQLVAGDFDDDGNVDVAGCSAGNNKLVVLYGDGAGGFTGPPTSINTGGFPLAIDAGDIDGDGDLELVTSNFDSGTWTIFENRLGSFINPTTLNASTAGSEVVLHDRDNDGDLDLTGLDEVDDYVYFYENEPPVLSAVRPTPGSPVVLLQNEPNPFNPSTVIRFELSADSDVDLSVFDASGAFVAALERGRRASGPHETRWDGTDAAGGRVGSGVYFYRLRAGGSTYTRKMVLLK